MRFFFVILTFALMPVLHTHSAYAGKKHRKESKVFSNLIYDIDSIFDVPEAPLPPFLTEEQELKIWIKARKNLEEVFLGVPKDVREKVLASRIELFEKKGMWPVPAGIPTTKWIKDVDETLLGIDPENDLREKIGLLGREKKYRIDILRTLQSEMKNTTTKLEKLESRLKKYKSELAKIELKLINRQDRVTSLIAWDQYEETLHKIWRMQMRYGVKFHQHKMQKKEVNLLYVILKAIDSKIVTLFNEVLSLDSEG
jgi:hypothetical protein